MTKSVIKIGQQIPLDYFDFSLFQHVQNALCAQTKLQYMRMLVYVSSISYLNKQFQVIG